MSLIKISATCVIESELIKEIHWNNDGGVDIFLSNGDDFMATNGNCNDEDATKRNNERLLQFVDCLFDAILSNKMQVLPEHCWTENVYPL